MLGPTTSPIGSPVGSQNMPLTDPEKNKFQIGFSLMMSGAPAQAYRIFKDLSKKPNISVQFNLALCYAIMGNHQEAVRLLEKVLQMMPTSPTEPVNDDVYLKLRPTEKKNADYRSPFQLELPVALPQFARECVRRCLIDSYRELEDWDKVRSIAAMVKEDGFDNVAYAVSEADASRGN